MAFVYVTLTIVPAPVPVNPQTVDHPHARAYELSLNILYQFVVCTSSSCQRIIEGTELGSHLRKVHGRQISNAKVAEILQVCNADTTPKLPPNHSMAIADIPILEGHACSLCFAAALTTDWVQRHRTSSPECSSASTIKVHFQRPFGGGPNSS